MYIYSFTSARHSSLSFFLSPSFLAYFLCLFVFSLPASFLFYFCSVFLYPLIFLDFFKLLSFSIFHFSYFLPYLFHLFFSSVVTSFSFFLFCIFCHFLLYLFYKSFYLSVSLCCLYLFICLFFLPLFHRPSHLSSFLTHFSFFTYFYLFLPFCYFIYPSVSPRSLSLYVCCICCSLISFASSPFSVPCCPYSLFLLSVPPSLPQLPVHWYTRSSSWCLSASLRDSSLHSRCAVPLPQSNRLPSARGHVHACTQRKLIPASHCSACLPACLPATADCLIGNWNTAVRVQVVLRD